MKDKYVFDSNIFINLHQRQPRDIYPSVWNKIDELMANGTIISSREVYDELTRSDDSLSEWAKSKKEYFLPSEIPIQERVRKILSEHRGLVEGGKNCRAWRVDDEFHFLFDQGLFQMLKVGHIKLVLE